MAANAMILDSNSLAQVTDLRHDLHRHPEICFQEARTAEQVTKWLQSCSIPYKAGLAKGTGVVAHLPSTRPGAPTIALRADMDALPILEATGLHYMSENPGLMHACGHDGHTAILCGAAHALARIDHRPNNILFLFQPAEEQGGGAQYLIQDGALNGGVLGNPVDMIFGLHGSPSHQLGEVSTCEGPMLAATAEFTISITGRGGHAAMPQWVVDPIVVGSQIVNALQTVVSRNTDPLDALVVSITTFHGGSIYNVIPDSVVLTGTFRTLSSENHELALRRIMEISQTVAQSMGATAEVSVGESGYPVTSNDRKAYQYLKTVLAATEGVRLGPDCLPIMGGEDFSFYGQAGVPACFYWLGLRNPGDATYPNLHTSKFDFNDAALEPGIRSLVALALNELS
jgi:amidohydrolase